MKLSSVIDGYFLEKRLTFAEGTIRNYRYVLDQLVGYLKDPEFTKIGADDLRRFLEYQSKRPMKGRKTGKLSKRSVHFYWPPLSSLWAWAEVEIKAENIVRGRIAQPTYQKRVIDPFTEDEIKRLLKHAEFSKEWRGRSGRATRSRRPTGLRDVAIIMTLIDSGMRVSELCALTLADYDQKKGRVHIQHGKRDKERFVYLGLRSQKSIWKYLASRGKTRPTNPLFASREGTHLIRENVHHLLHRIGENASVERVHPHRFRYSFAVRFVREGGNLFDLKAILGHEDLQQVLHYAAAASLDLESAARFSPADAMKL